MVNDPLDGLRETLNEALREAGLSEIQDGETYTAVIARLALVITKLRAKQQVFFTIPTSYDDIPVITAPSVPEGMIVYRINEPPEFLAQPRKRHPLYD